MDENKPTIRVFVTKYALTQGVFEIDAEDVGDGMIRQNGTQYSTYYHTGGYARTAEEAATQVRKQLDAKFKSIAKETAKLNKISDALKIGKLPERK